jgi:beta-mannosidase
MRNVTDLSSNKWTVSGWTPHLWRLMKTAELGETPNAEIMGVPAKVPGSVQRALMDAKILPDWRVGDNWRQCEWVENRHWIFETDLPPLSPKAGVRHLLECEGLDCQGWVLLNADEVGAFKGAHIPHTFDLTNFVKPGRNSLRIVFDLPPRWMGQFGYSSAMSLVKSRFNFTWDWQPRLVQIGPWEPIRLIETDDRRIEEFRLWADADPERGVGSLHCRINATGCARVRLTLRYNEHVMRKESYSLAQTHEWLVWRDLPVDLWWPNGEGAQHLYSIDCELLAENGKVEDVITRRTGFRTIKWQNCESSPRGSDPWLCVVNGKPIFLQGVNFPPLLSNFADTPADRYRKLVQTYRDLGVNCVRVNGVGHLERKLFYLLCDEMGILVWQDIPLSGSGVDSVPPSDPASVAEAKNVIRSFIVRRQHHPSLLLWCGGNELQRKNGDFSVPLTTAHPLIAGMEAIVKVEDPSRRFLPTTATGPRFSAEAKDFGKGLHWNTHGPWKLPGTMQEWRDYWEKDDSLFRAESGAPGASPAQVIREFCGSFDPMPISATNPAWRRPLTWWLEDGAFAQEHGLPPETLEEYVEWSQMRQAEALEIAVSACKKRFPKCGGILLWCGHEAFPCPTNTSILDYHGNPKPAAEALAKVWKT